MLFRLERIEKYVHNKEKYNSFEDLNNISSSNYNYNVIVVFKLFHMALRFHAVFYTKPIHTILCHFQLKLTLIQ